MPVDWSVLANVASAIAVIAAIVFGVENVRRESKRRRETAAVTLMQTFLSESNAAAHAAVLRLPRGITREQIEADPALRDDVRRALYLYENIGLLVHRRVIPLTLVVELIDIQGAWDTLEAHVRARQAVNPYSWEWFRWLIERIREKPAQKPAYVAHAAWRET